MSIERHADARGRAPGSALERLGYGDRVEVRVGDGSRRGRRPARRGAAILVAAAAPAVPTALREQLDPDGGRLVVPVGDRDRQELIVVTRPRRRLDRARTTAPSSFVPLIGEGGFGA